MSKLGEWLDKNRNVAVALDEFDRLEDKTQVVYNLEMLNEESENQIGIVMVSNQHPSRLNLDSRSQSRLNCQTLYFKPYSTPQLIEILEKRVEQAFRPETVPDRVIEEIAEKASENSGDCRQALNLLLRADRKADRDGKDNITIETIK